jgi:ABC-type transport system substrate-binding protein
LSAITGSEFTLTANPRYWAGEPAIATAHLLTNIAGRVPVAAFEAGDVDFVGISAYDAAWIRYDADLGPQLRVAPSLSLTYLGFDASRPPFDDVEVRQAVGAAVDWQRITSLGAVGINVPADSMVPPGIPGAPDGDWRPAHDPDAARALLASAGYPRGAGFPDVVFGTGFSPYADAIAADLERELGIDVALESYEDHFGRLITNPPGLFTVGWVADYPGPNDFLGVLLRTGSSNDYGRWSSSGFDAAVDTALSTSDATAATSAWRDVLGLVQRDVPVVPLSYGDSWYLSRDGLLGAGQNGLGLLRIAGLAWGSTP